MKIQLIIYIVLVGLMYGCALVPNKYEEPLPSEVTSNLKLIVPENKNQDSVYFAYVSDNKFCEETEKSGKIASYWRYSARPKEVKAKIRAEEEVFIYSRNDKIYAAGPWASGSKICAIVASFIPEADKRYEMIPIHAVGQCVLIIRQQGTEDLVSSYTTHKPRSCLNAW